MPSQENSLRLGIDSAPLERGVSKGKAGLSKLGKEAAVTTGVFAKLQKQTNLLRAAFVGLIAVSITKFFNGLVSSAANFETKISEVSTLVNAATFDMSKLTGHVLRQAKAFGQFPVVQAKASYDIISAGAQKATDANLILEASNKLATGGVTTTAIAADGLTSILNAYSLTAKDAADVSDILFVGVRDGKTTIEQLALAIGNVAPLAYEAGVGFDELVSTIAALTKGGISTARSVTGMRAIIAGVVKPTSEAAKEAERLGLEFNVAALRAKGFQGFLEDVLDKTQGNADSLGLLYGGVEALVPIMAFTGKAGENFNATLANMANRAGSTDAAFRVMADTFNFQGGRALTAIRVAFINLGTHMLKVLTPAVKAFADNFDTLSRFVGLAAVGFTAILLPSLIAVLPAIASVTAGFIAMAAAWLLTPFGAAAALITTAAGALAYFGETNVQVAGNSYTVWEVFIAIIKTIGDQFVKVANLFKGAFSFIGDIGKTIAAGLKERFGGFFSVVSKGLVNYVKEWFKVTGSTEGIVRRGINTTIGLFIGLFKTISIVVTKGLPAAFKAGMQLAGYAVVKGMEKLINLFGQGLGTIGDALENIPGFDGVGQKIRDALSVDFSESLISTDEIKKGLVDVGSTIKETFSDALSKDYVGAMADQVRAGAAVITGSFEGIKQDFYNNLPVREIDDFTETVEEAIPPVVNLTKAIGKLTDVQKEMKAILEEINGPQQDFILRQEALNMLLADGSVTLDQYNYKMREAQLAIIDFKLSVGEGTFADGFNSELGKMVTGTASATGQMGQAFGKLFTQLGNGFADTIGEAIVQGKDLGDSLRAVARSAISELISSLVKIGIQMVTNAILGNTLTAATTTASVAAAAATSAAWAVPAALVSLASFGANSVPATLGLLATTAVSKGLALAGSVGFADGTSFVDGPGTSRSDSILARLSKGEGVVNTRGNKANPGIVDAMNHGAIIGGAPTTVGVNVTVENHTSAQVQVQQLSPTEIRIIAREEAQTLISDEAPDLIASEIANPNSPISGALVDYTTAERAR